MKSKLPLSLDELRLAVDQLALPERQKVWVIKALKIVIKEVQKQKVRHKLIVYPDLQKNYYARHVVIGSYWMQQRRQRRRINLTFPKRGDGLPKFNYAIYLIDKLGEIYIRATGKLPTRGGTSSKYSEFERFASPFFKAVGVGDFRNRVRSYLESRNAQRSTQV